MEKDYVLTIVFSNWVLSKIFDFLQDYLDAKPEEIGGSKIDRYKDKRSGEMRDSNRTLILMKKSLFERATKAKLDLPSSEIDFRICEYMLSNKNYPIEGYCANFYIILPKNINTVEAEIALNDKFQHLVSFGLLKHSDYSLKIPLASRLTGEHRGFAYVSFSSSVDIYKLAYMKVLLHDSFMYLPSMNKLYHIPLFWAKQHAPPPSSHPIPIYQILKR